MADSFSSYQSGLDSPFANAFAITPSTAELTNFTRAIYCGGDGDIKFTSISDETVTLFGVLAGHVYPVRAKTVLVSTGTTAANLIGLY